MKKVIEKIFIDQQCKENSYNFIQEKINRKLN